MSALAVERPANPTQEAGEFPRLLFVCGGGSGEGVLHSPAQATGRGAGRRSPSRAGGLRLTQRGRLLRTLLVVAVLAVALSGTLERSVGRDDPRIDHATTVRAGQSLSDVAREQLPHLPVAEAVVALRDVNGMSSSHVVAGRLLLVPTR